MDQPVVGLLVCLGFVLGLAFLFFVIYRHHIRQVHRLSADSRRNAVHDSSRSSSLPFQVPQRWVAVRSSNTALVRELLGMADGTAVPWSEALARAKEPAFFISGPVDGWTLILGGRLPDPARDVDALFRWLHRLSRELGEVHFYAADRVVQSHAWARLDDGRVMRAYAWTGETQWNEGRFTLEERLLGLRCRDYLEEADPMRFGSVAPEVRNTDRVILLARRWSLDPVAASERLLQQEAVQSEDEDGGWN
ncbi:MAG: hypothetical protein KIT22_02475 [Verrucomicrobiae bacterium]|nr:hypothetical protein [Verrucomicrobiae bacterium]